MTELFFFSNFEEDEDMDEEAMMVTCGKLTLNPASEDNMMEEKDNNVTVAENMAEEGGNRMGRSGEGQTQQLAAMQGHAEWHPWL